MTSVETLGEFLGYEVTGQFRPTVKFVRIPTENGSVPIEQAFFVMSPTEGALAIPSGPKGDPGPKGDAALPWQLQPDTYATAADLELAYQHLGDGDEGKAWFVGTGNTRALYRWSGTGWEVYEDLVVRGPVGPPVQITGGTVTILDPEEAPVFQVNGDQAAGQVSIHIGIPQPVGEKGDPGDTVINLSSYETPPVDGQMLTANPATGKLKPLPVRRVRGPYTLSPNAFSAISVPTNDGTLRGQVASLTIPPQPYPHRLMVQGNVQCTSGSATRVSIEGRLGDPVTGTLIAYGEGRLGMVRDAVHFTTVYEQSVDADNTADLHAIIPADASEQQRTLYLSAVKVEGMNQPWSTRADRAQLVVWVVPA
ncbi:Bacteriophage minor tail subunit [Mycobacteroides abscessus subsp. abscessus]|nr:Bacteriophage minor tail subunit [Mycobacteroides abscessus subsp. abscessus]